MDEGLKRVRWVGSSLRETCDPFRRQSGVISVMPFMRRRRAKPNPAAKPLKGFGRRLVMEIVAPFDGNTWRAVYTVRFQGAVYVLHSFQKKSKSGIATPKAEIDLIHQRLAAA